ncbi:type II toxin-antitoxin system RelE/ParE family toxin [Bradyrhizobium daqingense]|uniref:type II toxin-antitoxin system RelE/ParE family toxin n=1 Tax=Bradyrhizobium daqingense TaxID=993502 RepID=UPI001E405743|nr:type II toxin-antitoxin system RelE/ParE family toxin [Bradyrhizobium daqingense]UFS91461.1 type II toxin-antitoxin system RelE/ParE family toxin [Bradyrhizobium daqingense]
MNIRYTLPALADLESILTYIAETSPQGAARVQKRIQDVISLLPAHPEIGLRTDDSDIRRLTTTPYPFLASTKLTARRSSSTPFVMALAIPAGCPASAAPSSLLPP